MCIKIEKKSMDTVKLARLIRLIVIKQWFHSIYALVNTNKPDGMFGDDNSQAADEIQRIAWKRYCAIADEIRELTKDTELSKYCF